MTESVSKMNRGSHDTKVFQVISRSVFLCVFFPHIALPQSRAILRQQYLIRLQSDDYSLQYIMCQFMPITPSVMHELVSDWPCRGWTTARCLLGFVAAGCFLCRGAVLFLKTGSCLVLDFSSAERLNNIALLSNSFCFSLSSCENTKRKIKTEEQIDQYKRIRQHPLNHIQTEETRLEHMPT